MIFRERLKFYIIGFLAGIMLVVLFFGKRSSCKNYVTAFMPNERVLTEIQSMPITYSEEAINQIENTATDTAYINQVIFRKGNIDFDNSEPRAKPCGKYLISHSDSTKTINVNFKKCKRETIVQNISFESLK